MEFYEGISNPLVLNLLTLCLVLGNLWIRGFVTDRGISIIRGFMMAVFSGWRFMRGYILRAFFYDCFFFVFSSRYFTIWGDIGAFFLLHGGFVGSHFFFYLYASPHEYDLRVFQISLSPQSCLLNWCHRKYYWYAECLDRKLF